MRHAPGWWVLFPFLPAVASCSPAFHVGKMPGEPARATYAEVGGARIRYVDEGEGPVVVLVHGFASSLETWEAVRPVLRTNHRVISLDLKGFGWSDRPPGDYSPRAQANLILELLNERGINEPFALVAHSWGSSIALALTLAAPERVSRLAFYDAWVYEEQLPTFFHWARQNGVGEALFSTYYKERSDDKIAQAFYDKRFVTEKLVEDVERALDRPGTVAAALAAVRGQRFTEMQARYRTIQQPALLLWGREDTVTLLSYGERLAADLPHGKLIVYPRCGHFPMIEAASASTRDLVAFLDEPGR